MQDREVRDLLEETFARLMPGEPMAQGRKKYAQLRLQREEQEVACGENLYGRARSALQEKASLLEEEPETRLLLLTGSGVRGNSPTVVELQFTAERMVLTAWAKEGLIPQRSARRAIQAIRAALEV